MATRWSTPGVVFREQDNTVRNNADPGNGRGAIVLNANKGYPNQRILNTSINDFYKMYDTPDNVNQYGHFAAANFFAAGSQQLLTVRATMGDEGYAVVQYPYTDAASVDTCNVAGIQQYQFVNNNLDDGVKLITPINSASWAALSANGFNPIPAEGSTEMKEFALSATGSRAILKDVFDEFNSDDSYTMYVYRDDSDAAGVSTSAAVPGRYYRFVNQSGRNATYVEFTLKDDAINSNFSAYSLKDNPDVVNTDNDVWTNYAWYNATSAENEKYWNVDMFIPANSAVNGKEGWVTGIKVDNAVFTDASGSLKDSVAFTDLIAPENLQIGALPDFEEQCELGKDEINMPYLKDSEDGNGQAVSLIKVSDWDDMETKSFVVRTDATNRSNVNNLYAKTLAGVQGLEYKEYGMAEYNNVLVVAGEVVAVMCDSYTGDKFKELVAIAEEYGVDATELTNGKYAVLSYKPAKTWLTDEDTVVKVIRVDDTHSVKPDTTEYTGLSDALFVAYQEVGATKMTQQSVIRASTPQSLVKPWQVDDGETVSKLIAMSTTEVMADSTGTWSDGYTSSCDTEEEPGNGDIETFESNQQNQLVIAALGPGEWGNDIGVSVITAEAAKYPCLYHANAFSWKYRYDDEDKVDNAEYPDNYEHNAENLTWKKVYRINVYAKPKDKTSKIWGFGLDALTADPIESWYVSNDPNAKDAEGNTLYAPYVINGRSNYIYVSKKSVATAADYKGNISQPKMTWSIYQLQGGTNSKLNNIKEKTAALKLYEDRSKADFDILFNVEAIDTFNGKQRYSSHQRRIGEIAAQRGMDIGVIQTTSKEAKTIRLELSEAKSFSFNNGSYVAAYAGYDRYFDSYTSNWVYLPKSVAGACAMCYCDVYSYPWMAPAGLQNGQISYSNRSNIRLSNAEFGQLYDNNINTSLNHIGYGEVLMGQKTMLKKESALNRINVRRLVNYIEKNLETMLVPYLFQQNTVNTRTSMKTTVDAFLSRIQSAGGVISKRVSIATDPDDSHIVYVNINIIPAESIEWICVTVTVDRNNGVQATEA